MGASQGARGSGDRLTRAVAWLSVSTERSRWCTISLTNRSNRARSGAGTDVGDVQTTAAPPLVGTTVNTRFRAASGTAGFIRLSSADTRLSDGSVVSVRSTV